MHPSKNVIYFQDLDENRIDTISLLKSHVIEPHDIIQIQVTSSSQEADMQFSKSELSFNPGPNNNYTINGYLIDSSGSFDFPYLGSVYAKGLTLYELKQSLKKQLEPFLKNPSINARIINYKVSILGEVLRPGTYNLPVERITIAEALSLAGDLTINAKRENLLIIREVNGTRIYKRINLKTSAVFDSDFYYLRSDDIIYVQPSKTKLAQADASRWQLLTLITSTLSLIVVLITSLNN